VYFAFITNKVYVKIFSKINFISIQRKITLKLYFPLSKYSVCGKSFI